MIGPLRALYAPPVIRRLMYGLAAATAVALLLGACDDPGKSKEPASINFDTSSNIYTIDAPIKKKGKKKHGFFEFEVPEGSGTHRATALVADDIYDSYDVGDRIRLRCTPGGDPCEVLP